jgi:hypothetical protein
MKYKSGDKLVIKIDEIDASSLNRGSGANFWNKQLLGKLEDFQPAEEKIKMTVEEKKEFDNLYSDNGQDVSDIFDEINDCADDYPNLCKRLFSVSTIENFHSQIEFVRALEKPSRIEVEEKKYWIKLADGYLVNVMGDWLTLKNKKDGDIFTQSEIDELQKQEQFKAIDLNQCKEEVEDE